MQTEVDVLLGERPAGVGANAAAILGAVGGQRCARGREAATGRAGKILRAGKYAVTEAAVNAENFVVPETRLEGRFHDDIRRWVKGVIGQVSGGAGCGSAGACIIK